MAVEKEPGGSEGSSEHTSGNWGGAGFQHRRNTKAQPYGGSWQFKDSVLSRVGGTWKTARVPWSGYHFPPSALLYILFLFQQPKLYCC